MAHKSKSNKECNEWNWKQAVEESSNSEMNAIPNHLFRAWSNENNVLDKMIKPKIDLNIECAKRYCGNIHYKIHANNVTIIVLCHFESCNINDNQLILLSPRLQTILFDLFMKLKNEKCAEEPPSFLNNKIQILLQLFLSNNNFSSSGHGLIALLNMISSPIIYVDYLCLSRNLINDMAAFYIKNYFEKCSILPHRIDLSATKITDDGINCIIKGMIQRENNENNKMLKLTELENKLKLMQLSDDCAGVIIGVAIDDKDKNKLFVPLSIIVDKSINIESLASNATKNVFICTGADYKYIGYGECNENYCAVAATICTEQCSKKNINLKTLPLIHLFYKEIIFLSLLLNEESLQYLLCTAWNININDNITAPQELVDKLYGFCYYLRGESLKSLNINKWNRLLLKIFETTKLNVDKLKVSYLAKSLLQKATHNNNDINPSGHGLKQYRQMIKHYIVQNKQTPFSINKWKEIIKIKMNCNDLKLVYCLAKYAANLIQSKWNIEKELINIVSSNYIKFILLTQQCQSMTSVMEFMLEKYAEKSFGLQYSSTAFCIQTTILKKYKSQNKFNHILKKAIKAQILYEIEDINHITNDILFVNGNHSENKTINILDLHRKLFVSSHANLWNRSFFET